MAPRPTTSDLSGPPDPQIMALMCQMARRYGPKILLATFETAIVESGIHNLNWGSEHSHGVFQQQWDAGGYGTPADTMNPPKATRMFLDRLVPLAAKRPDLSAGQLAAAVQRPREDLVGRIRPVGQAPGADREALLMRCRTLIALLAAVLASGCLAGCGDEPAAKPVATVVDDDVSAKDAARPVAHRPDPDGRRARRRAQRRAAAQARRRQGGGRRPDRHMGIRPTRVEFAKGGGMEDLVWQRWGDRGAQGSGRMVGVVCEPDCGHGREIDVPATIRLSEPVACAGRRFFDRGEIVVASDDPDASPPRGWRPRARPALRAGRRGARDGRGARTAGTASARSARGTSGRPTGPARPPARR